MCVINIISNLSKGKTGLNYPSKSTIESMALENPHGNSITYFDEIKQKIVYHKAITLKQLHKHLAYCKKNNYKTILHHRIASVGSHEGIIGKSLNHPFKIINGNQNDLSDITNNDILIHNGTLDLKELQEIAIKILLNDKKAQYPKGELSDTKLLSWILSHVNYSILNMMTSGNKFVIMNGINGNISTYGNFQEIKDKDNSNTLICSNDYFNKEYVTYNDNYAEYGLNSTFYMDSEEKKESNRLIKKYKEYGIDLANINEYLDMGYDIFDIEDIIKSEIKYASEDYIN
jgi:hypothetical protein